MEKLPWYKKQVAEFLARKAEYLNCDYNRYVRAMWLYVDSTLPCQSICRIRRMLKTDPDFPTFKNYKQKAVDGQEKVHREFQRFNTAGQGHLFK